MLIRILNILSAVAIASLFALPATAVEPATKEQWTPLFNGHNFDGWYTFLQDTGKNQDPQRVFQVHDGVIHLYKDHKQGSAAQVGYFGSNADYSYYHLRFQFKWGGKRFAPRVDVVRDTGLLYHLVGNDVVWPRSIECQVQERDVGDCYTVYGTQVDTTVDPQALAAGEYHYLDSTAGGVPVSRGSPDVARTIKSATHEVDGWNTVEVIVRGSEGAVHIVNGKVNFRATNLRTLGPDGKSWLPLTHGRIVFQAEYAEVLYRNIEIREIPDGPLLAAIDRQPPLQVPEGFSVRSVASPSLVKHPMMGCLDDRGRLFVCESAGMNAQADELLATRPHKILLLEDNDGDGRFDRSTVFADELVEPNGVLWHDGALFVCSSPYLWRFEDADGDGRAERRTPILGKFNFNGLYCSFHGPSLGPDGRLYWCGGQIGWFLRQVPNGTPLDKFQQPDVSGGWYSQAPGVFSCRLDGSDAEHLASGGICNPVELAFSDEGDAFGTVAVYSQENSKRDDAILHWVRGGVYNLSPHLQNQVRRTGGPLPQMSSLGHSAPSGIVRYRGDQFGTECANNLFHAEFNTHRIVRTSVERDGATFRSRATPFLTSTDADTHFTDILEDADGSLLVFDTGGWFLNGCPTSQVAKPEILGGIYRVTHTASKPLTDPRGKNLDWAASAAANLVEFLGDPRFAVRDRAVAELAQRGPAVVAALNAALQSDLPLVRRNAVWALTRIDSAAARAAVRVALTDKDVSVVQSAIHSVGTWRDAAASKELVKLLTSDRADVCRQAASAVGRIGNPAAAPALLASLGKTSDRFVEHALIYALIEINDREATLPGLQAARPQVQRGALIALDQMPDGKLTRDAVAPLLSCNDQALQQSALEIVARHQGWADEIIGSLAQWLKRPDSAAERQTALVDALLALRDNPAVQQLISEALGASDTPKASRQLLLDYVARRGRAELPAVWLEPLKQCLASTDASLVQQTIAALNATGARAFDQTLQPLALDASRPLSLRAAAAATLVSNGRPLHGDIFALLVQQSSSETEPVARLAAATALGKAALNETQLVRVCDLIAKAGPLELPGLLRAFEESATTPDGGRLVAALLDSPGTMSLSATRLRALLDRYPPAIQAQGAPLFERLKIDTAAQTARLDELQFALTEGVPARGREVFFGRQAVCSACHRVGNEGGQIGPNLSQIGEIRTRRDLLEAVVFPSASLARGFEPVSVSTTSGRTHTGIVSRQTPDTVFLQTADRVEIPIPRDEIDELVPSTISIMPQGLDRVLGPEQLQDLLAYLVSLKNTK